MRSFVPDGYVQGRDIPFTVNQAADDLWITVENVAEGDSEGGGEGPVDSDDGGDGPVVEPGSGKQTTGTQALPSQVPLRSSP